jgi:hemin uptake protein HemP
MTKRVFLPSSAASAEADKTAMPLRQSLALLNATRQLSSASLLQGAPEVEIAHNGAIYRLRQTSQGKLILTK